MKPAVKKLVKEDLNEEFIFIIADFFPTSELILIFRPLSSFFNNSLKNYLP
jgi:hypothetical protein